MEKVSTLLILIYRDLVPTEDRYVDHKLQGKLPDQPCVRNAL